MYELIIYDKNKSYILFGNSGNLNDYPTIPVGATVFILDTKEVFTKCGPDCEFQLDLNDVSGSAILGKAVLGNMIIGKGY